MASPAFKVFVSHISEEAPIGHVLKEWIEDAFAGQVAVFVSSDPRDLPGGKRWLEQIEGQLRDDSVRLLISVLSPASVQRPWISLEFGGAWIKGTSILPLCHSGLTGAKLPRPLSDFQGTGIDDKEVCEKVVNAVSAATGLTYPRKMDFAGMRGALEKAINECSASSQQESFWETADDSRPTKPRQAMAEVKIRILKLLAEAKDRNARDCYVSVDQIARALGMKTSICDVHVSEMRLEGLVLVSLNYLTGSSYAISDQGTRLLMELGELG